MHALGRQVLVELYNCKPEMLNDVTAIEKSMVGAAEEAGATVINSTFHHFSPFGVSGVVVIQESHLAIHTWPEYGYAAIDIFTCGQPVNPWMAYEYLQKSLQASHGSTLEIRRGQLSLVEPTGFNIGKERSEKEKRMMPKFTRNIWFTDRDDYVALSLRHTGDPLFKEKSPYQKVEIYNTYGYGKMLANDGMVMCTEKDEFVYHEMITHVAMHTHKKPKRALVIGGGDGGTVRELLRYPSLEKLVMVEIDQVVIDACREHLPSISCELDNPRLDLRVEDGIKYVSNSADESFDIVIVDSTDPIGPSEGLFGEAFYREVYRILDKDGIMITQSESPRFNAHVFKDVYKTYRNIFGPEKVHCYLAFIPTYPSGMWSFSYSSKGDHHPVNDLRFDEAAAFTHENNLKYYSAEMHRAAFVLPKFVENILDE